MNNKISLDDIFDDDDFNKLESKRKTSHIKTEEDRLIDSFEEINVFFDKNQREPSTSSMSEYSLLAKLKNFRQEEEHKKVLKPFDRHNLLGHVELEKPSLDDVLGEIDDLDLLGGDKDELSIFQYKHTPKPQERSDADFVAQRKPMKEKEFAKYEAMFAKVHKELNEGKRSLKSYENAGKNLKAGNYYVLNGMLLYFEDADIEVAEKALPSGARVRLDGRTKIVFENGTYSNMLYRSLDKALLNQANDGRIVTVPDYEIEKQLANNANAVSEEDVESGWIYILQSKSANPEIVGKKDLYKIGYSTVPVEERIKNAVKEPTYLMAEVKIISAFKCYNLNTQKFEQLIQRFFAEACLEIDVHGEGTKRYNPREWFVVPIGIIDKVIQLIISGDIVKYRYDHLNKVLIEK